MVAMIFETGDNQIFDEELKKNTESVLEYAILYKYMSVEGTIEALKNSTIKFSAPETFNDPFDCDSRIIDLSNPSEEYYKHIVDIIAPNAKFAQRKRKLIEIRKQGIHLTVENVKKVLNQKIACLTIHYNNLLMWAHYAGGHTGCCIGWDFERLFRSLIPSFGSVRCLKVKYVDDLPIIDYFKCPKRAAISWSFVKSNVWQYEDEIRLVVEDSPESLCSYVPVPSNIFKAIYLGTKISEEKKNEIIQICRDKYSGMKIYKMELKSGKFELEPVQIPEVMLSH